MSVAGHVVNKSLSAVDVKKFKFRVIRFFVQFQSKRAAFESFLFFLNILAEFDAPFYSGGYPIL